MTKTPWLTIIGIGEEGRDGLGARSQAALAQAEVILAPPRHLALISPVDAQTIVWPVPFRDGLEILETLRGRRVVVLVSGDPFWFGAGTTIARHLQPGEWQAIPAPSTFSLVAARLGWPLEKTVCMGLHAKPVAQIYPHLAQNQWMILLLRDGEAPGALARYLTAHGFGDSLLHVFERLGGASERRYDSRAKALCGDFAHPVCVALRVEGEGAILPKTTGLPDATFEHDGQITKRPMRAITLSTLAPRPYEHLWDIGAGSGSIALEWLLADPQTTATAVEARPDRADRILRNAQSLGVAERLHIKTGQAPEALAGLPPAQAIFIGGGISQAMLEVVSQHKGARLVANAVTVEGDALLSDWHGRLQGTLMRYEFSSLRPLGHKRAWSAAYPVVQWSVEL